MAGYVIDPSTGLPEKVDDSPVFTPAPGQDYYALTLNGTPYTAGVEVFAEWDEANNVAQMFQNGLDEVDNRAWGVVRLTAPN